MKVPLVLSSRTTPWKSARFRGGATLLSVPLPNGLRFFQLPLPATPAVFLADAPASPPRRDVGFTMLDCDDMNDLAPAFTPTVLIIRVFHDLGGTSDCEPFWFEPVSIFGSFDFDGACWQFTSVGHITQPSPQTTLILAVSETSSRLSPRPWAEFFCLGSFRRDRYQSRRCRYVVSKKMWCEGRKPQAALRCLPSSHHILFGAHNVLRKPMTPFCAVRLCPV